MPLCMVVGVQEQLFSSCMAHLSMGWLAIYVKQNHQYIQSPSFSISSFNDWTESGMQLLLPNFSLYIASFSDRVWCTWGSYSTDLLPMLLSHTSLAIRSNNIYFLLIVPHSPLAAEGKQVRFHSALVSCKRSLILGTCDSINKSVETLECVHSRAIKWLGKKINEKSLK